MFLLRRQVFALPARTLAQRYCNINPLQNTRFCSWVGQPSLTDPSQSYLSKWKNPLESLFEPKRIAVVGATDRQGSVGRTLFQNLIGGAGDGKTGYELYPVNPTKDSLFSFPCFKSLIDVPVSLDLAVVVTPAKTVQAVMEQALAKRVKSAIVISAGFKELGESGLQAEQALVNLCKAGNIRLIGPNCLGVMNPLYHMNASFAADIALPGHIAFISQSGAMCTAVLDWSLNENIGFSAFVSIGSMADINWGDLIEYFGHDVNTSSILIYMETIGDAQSFLSAAKEVARSKPIIVIKAGKTEAAAKAAASHTGSLAGAYDAFEAAMKRVGVLMVDSIGELFSCARVLGKQPPPDGPNLLIITNAGGPAVLATDALVSTGGALSSLDTSTLQRLNQTLPDAWSRSNPVDILGDASASVYASTLEEVSSDKNANGILVILSPQDVTDPTTTANQLQPVVQAMKGSKLLMASWMGGKRVKEGKNILTNAGIPTFEYPDEAAATFSKIWQRTKHLEMMYEIPELTVEPYARKQIKSQAIAFLEKQLKANTLILTETDSKTVFEMYGLPTVKSSVCTSLKEAIRVAKKVGFPVVLKIHSDTLTHKKDVGGVQLNLKDAQAVEDAFLTIEKNVTDLHGKEHFKGVSVQKMINISSGIELILGSYADSQFGPLIMFGSGGTFVEIFKDRSLAVPPLNTTLAHRLMEETKIYKALVGGKGKRFEGIQMDELAAILVRFSQMIVDLREYIEECDINPLFATSKELLCLDGRISLFPKNHPAPPLAVRPFPSEYVFSFTLKNGERVNARPLHSNDEHALKRFHEKLSKETIKQRYLADIALETRAARHALLSVCNADYSKLIAFAAFDESDEILGISRLTKFPNNPQKADFKLAIRDDYQNKGLGTFLLEKVIQIAKNEELSSICALILEENDGMLKMMKRQNFTFAHNSENAALIEATLHLSPTS